MKKTTVLAFGFLAITAVAGVCATKEQADVYEPTAIPLPARKKTTSLFSRKVTETVTLAKSSVFRYNFLNTNVDTEDMEIFYDPQTQSVGITLDAKGSHRLMFDTAALRSLRAAFEKYDAAFEAQTLVSKKTKYAKTYGKIRAVYLVKNLLGDIRYEPNITCGYVFVDKSPYFIITIPETKSSLHNPVDDERTRVSSLEKLLFNRNQMRTILEQTSNANIAQALLDAEGSKNAADNDAAASDSQ